MPTAELLTIGTEILLGEIQDTNTAFLAKILKDLGIDLYRTQTVGDNSSRITQSIQDALSRADILITTGGLGPTVDDPTRQAAADAMGIPLEFYPACWEQIQSYFISINRQIPINNKRQAYLPQGAQVINNPVGTAPGFIAIQNEKVLISLPGVPKEMERLITDTVIPFLQTHFNLHSVIRTKVMHVSGIGEAQLDDMIGEFEKLANPTVGLLAKTGVVDIRVGAKAETISAADEMIEGIFDELKSILGNNVFGYDQDTLIGVVTNLITQYTFPVRIVVNGLTERLSKGLQHQIPQNCILEPNTEKYNENSPRGNELIFNIHGNLNKHPAEVNITVHTPDGKEVYERKYAGPPEMADLWSYNIVLDIMRRTLMSRMEG